MESTDPGETPGVSLHGIIKVRVYVPVQVVWHSTQWDRSVVALLGMYQDELK